MATTRNAITGALIKSKPTTDEFRSNYGNIDWNDKGEKAKDAEEVPDSKTEEGSGTEST